MASFYKDTAAILDVPVQLIAGATEESPPGVYAINATGASDSNYTITHQDGTLTVTERIAPEIHWTPAPVIYGMMLGDDQLNARAIGDIDGDYKYEPDAGAVLEPGEHWFEVTFEPREQTTLPGGNRTSDGESGAGAVDHHCQKCLAASWCDESGTGPG